MGSILPVFSQGRSDSILSLFSVSRLGPIWLSSESLVIRDTSLDNYCISIGIALVDVGPSAAPRSSDRADSLTSIFIVDRLESHLLASGFSKLDSMIRLRSSDRAGSLTSLLSASRVGLLHVVSDFTEVGRSHALRTFSRSFALLELCSFARSSRFPDIYHIAIRIDVVSIRFPGRMALDFAAKSASIRTTSLAI